MVASCLVTSQYIHSLDNVTWSSSLSPCYSLVSSDCGTEPLFAVFVRSVAGEIKNASSLSLVTKQETQEDKTKIKMFKLRNLHLGVDRRPSKWSSATRALKSYRTQGAASAVGRSSCWPMTSTSTTSPIRSPCLRTGRGSTSSSTEFSLIILLLLQIERPSPLSSDLDFDFFLRCVHCTGFVSSLRTSSSLRRPLVCWSSTAAAMSK